jgi:glutathione S-transferase
MLLYAIPHSTNVERVALAIGHKGLDAELILCDPGDRSPVQAVSGQELVPVLDDDGTIVTDSSRIIEHLEQRHPTPALFPEGTVGRAHVRLFVSWFDRVWKRAPNAIADELALPQPDVALIGAADGEMRSTTTLVAEMLDGREYLAGDRFGAADCAAFPFLKYARGADAGDDDLFHRVLAERLAPFAADERVAAWIERVDARPRRPHLG